LATFLLVFVFFLPLVFLAADFLPLLLVPILLFAFVFNFDLAAFLVVVAFFVVGSSTSQLVVLIGPGGVVVEGSVDSVDSVDILLS
jgi:hypothetical protein